MHQGKMVVLSHSHQADAGRVSYTKTCGIFRRDFYQSLTRLVC